MIPGGYLMYMEMLDGIGEVVKCSLISNLSLSPPIPHQMPHNLIPLYKQLIINLNQTPLGQRNCEHKNSTEFESLLEKIVLNNGI
jgi:hypothetical protein